MEVQIGNYRLTVPDNDLAAMVDLITETSQTDSAPIQIGPFRLSTNLLYNTLDEWRELVWNQTKYEAAIEELEVNGIPGLTIRPGPLNSRRLDYVFQAPGYKCISIVAWSDTPTTVSQREVVQRVVQTLRVL